MARHGAVHVLVNLNLVLFIANCRISLQNLLTTNNMVTVFLTAAIGVAVVVLVQVVSEAADFALRG